MKKIFSFLLLFFISIASTVTIFAQQINTLVVNYYRFYDLDSKHTAWVWQNEPAAKDGKEFTFELHPNSHWLTTTVDLTDEAYSGSTRMGIIIKKGAGWDGVVREPGGDRFFNLNDLEIIDNKYQVYFIQGDETVYHSKSEAKVVDAIFDLNFSLDKKINVTLTNAGNWKLFEDGTLIESGSTTVNKFIIIPSNTIDISKTYVLKVDFVTGTSAEKSVSLINLYNTDEFNNAYYYDGDLGVKYTKEKTTFKLWSPLSSSATLNLYHQGHPDYANDGSLNKEETPFKTYPMTRKEKGVFECIVNENLDGVYYTFSNIVGNTNNEFVDPYAMAVGVNGVRGMVVDFELTNPYDWQSKKPNTIKNLTDYIIYELHVRDLTTSPTWNGKDEWRGTFMGLTQKGTTYTKGDITVKTGLDHLIELGINAVHLLPIFDYGYVDETRLDDDKYMAKHGFNWGYMPENFNALQGSYSTNPYDGSVRIKEFKRMVQTLHNNGIRVIMDVVYNHTARIDDSNFQCAVPDYYFRKNDDGGWANGSGTGNETASERLMVRKYIIDSVLFWAKEYNISGFRFDLMGLHDIETMNAIREAVNEVDPTIIIYGEPWTGGTSPLPDTEKAIKSNMDQLNVASFNDNSRNSIKGWAKGDINLDNANAIRYALAGAVPINGVYAEEGRQTFHEEPFKVINYVSVHDNSTLRDELYLGNVRFDNLKAKHKLANSVILLSQGIPFLHAGVDMMRSKYVPLTVEFGDDNRVDEVYRLSDNSYNLPDIVNQLNYENKVDNLDVFNHYKSLITLRRLLPSLRMATKEEVINRLEFIDLSDSIFVVKIKGNTNEPEIKFVINGSTSLYYYSLDKAAYRFTNKAGNVFPKGFRKASQGFKIEVVPNSVQIIVEEHPSVDFDPEVTSIDFGIQDHGLDFISPLQFNESNYISKNNLPLSIEFNLYQEIPVTELTFEFSDPNIATVIIENNQLKVNFVAEGKTTLSIKRDNVVLATINLETIHEKTNYTPLIIGIVGGVIVIATVGVGLIYFFKKKRGFI